MKLLFESESPVREIELTGPSYTIGRGSASDIRLNQHDLLASRTHARIFQRSGQYFIADLESMHGTLINGKKLREPVLLHNNDTIEMGETRIRVLAEEQPDAEKAESITDNDLEQEDFTRVMDQDELYRLIHWQLVALNPESIKDTVFPLDKEEIFLGRTVGDILLADDSVSNPHALISREGSRYFLEDKGSTNGTFVNNEQVQEKRELQEGDTIRLGRVILMLRDQQEHPQAADEVTTVDNKHSPPPTDVRPYPRIFYLLVIASLLISSYLVYDRWTTHHRPPAPKSSAIKQEIQSLVKKKRQDQLYITMQTADDFARNEMWADAIGKYEAIIKKQPDYDNVAVKLTRARAEQKNKTIFQQGLRLLEQNKLKEATRIFESLPADSLYRNRSQQAVKRVRDLRKKKKKETSRKQQADKLLHLAHQAYLNGNIELAGSLLQRVTGLGLPKTSSQFKQARRELNIIQVIDTLYQQGFAAFKRGDLNQAVILWNQLLSKEQPLIGTHTAKSFFDKKIAIYLADEFYQQANIALQNGDQQRAVKYCREVLGVRPDHQSCRKILGIPPEQAPLPKQTTSAQ